MSGSARAKVMLSVDEFLVYDTPEGKAELVRGELRLNPPAFTSHGVVVAAIVGALVAHVDAHGLGVVLTSGGFELIALPRTVRCPDAAFIRTDRLPVEGFGERFSRIAPDLAVEVISPSETRARLREKLEDYAASNIPLVWLIDPKTRTVTIVEPSVPTRRLNHGEVLTGGSVLPGFSCEVSKLFIDLKPR